MSTPYEMFSHVNTEFANNTFALLAKQDIINGKQLSFDDFVLSGDYVNLRARATTKDDVGLNAVDNIVTETIRQGVTKNDIGLSVVANNPPATKEDAEAGNTTGRYMTAKSTSQHRDIRINNGLSDPDNNDGVPDGGLYFKKDTLGKAFVKTSGIYKQADVALRTHTSSNRAETSVRIKQDGQWLPVYRNSAVYVIGIHNLYNLGQLFYTKTLTTPTNLGLHDIKQLDRSQRGFRFIRKDGTLWFSGENTWQTAGIGSNMSVYDRHVQEARGYTNWKFATGGWNYSAALREDGSLYTCGASNMNGHNAHLGLFTRLLSPHVFSQLCASFQTGYVLRTDGTIWVWGNGWTGELGNGSLEDWTNTPIQSGTHNDWASLPVNCIPTARCFAIKNNGTLWAVGHNSGTLGVGHSNTIANWEQVGIDNDWHKVSAGRYNVTLALKQDGTLWAWGENDYGQNGTTGGTTNSPVKINNDTDWVDIFTSWQICGALKADGRLYLWGRNDNGGLLMLGRPETRIYKPTLVTDFYPVKSFCAYSLTTSILMDI